MSRIDTEGRSSRLRTRAQKCAMTSESAPRSSKKWLSTGTCSVFTTAASTSARLCSVSCSVPAEVLIDTRTPCIEDPAGLGGMRPASRPERVERVRAVQVLDPVGLVDGVEVALAQVRGDGHRGDLAVVVAGQPLHRAADHRAGGAAEQEPAPGQAVAGPDGGRLLDGHDVV